MSVRTLAISLSVLALTASLVQAQGLHSASVLEFADAETLFVGHSVEGAIHAFDLPKTGAAPAAPPPSTLLDLDGMLAEALGTDPRGFTYHDLAVHPVTQEAYISLTATMNGAEEPAVVTLAREGTVQRIDLSLLPSHTFTLQAAADGGVTFWREIPAARLTVTELDFPDGERFVSGLSTGEFAWRLRRVLFAFCDTAGSTRIGMFHAAQSQTETRGSIRAMTFMNLDGVSTVVAAYTCTPLVTVPVADLVHGANITGRTIPELGYGSTPLDVPDFGVTDTQGNAATHVLVINHEMDAELISLAALTVAAHRLGVATTPIPLAGVFQAADQDARFVLARRRNMDTGAMDPVSVRKGVT